jgi:hypothetical protein
MNKIQFIGISLLASLISAPVFANKATKFSVKSLQGFNKAPKIYVYSNNGEKYTHVDKTKITDVEVAIDIKCKYEGRGNKAYDGDLRVPGYTHVSENNPNDYLIPNVKTASRKFRYDTGNGQPLSPLKVCNDELNKKLSQNASKSKYEILAKGFTVNYPAALQVYYNLRCNAIGLGQSSFGGKSPQINTKYHCQASDIAKSKIPKPKPKPIPTPKRAKLVPMVSKVTFKADPTISVGECPARINFLGHITATRKGKVSYRYVKNDGKKSPLYTLNFNKAGTKKTARWGMTASQPKASQQLNSAGGQQSQYEVQGHYRLVIESPKTKLQAIAEYKVDCDKKKPGLQFKG